MHAYNACVVRAPRRAFVSSPQDSGVSPRLPFSFILSSQATTQTQHRDSSPLASASWCLSITPCWRAGGAAPHETHDQALGTTHRTHTYRIRYSLRVGLGSL